MNALSIDHMQAMPYLESLGRGVFDVGDSPRLGHVMKLVGNFYIMSMMELIAEGMTLADKNGLKRDAVVHFLKESFQGPITGGQRLVSPLSSEPSIFASFLARSLAIGRTSMSQ